MEKAVAKYAMTEVEITQRLGLTFEDIAELDKRYRSIKVADADDDVNYKAAHTARMSLVHFRTNIAKGGKALRDEANAFSKFVISVEKKIVEKVQPIEDHLLAQEKIVDDEKDRIKAVAAAVEAARVQARIDRLIVMGCIFNGSLYKLPYSPDYYVPHPIVATASDEQFEEICAKFQISVDAENARIEKVKADKLAEEQRMATIRTEQEAEAKRLSAIAKEQADTAAKIKADQDAIEKEKQHLVDSEIARNKKAQDEKDKAAADKKHKEELEIAKKEAAEKAVKETEEKRIKEEKAKADKIEKERIAAEKKAARAPDKEKLLKFAEEFEKPINPFMNTIEGKQILDTFNQRIEDALMDLREIVETL